MLSGGLGNDGFWGGSGDDVIYGDSGRNEAHGGEGADTVLLTPVGILTIHGFNPGEGDRLIVDADFRDPGDFYVQAVMDADGVRENSFATILHRFDHETAYRTVAEIHAPGGMDRLQLYFPHDAGGPSPHSPGTWRDRNGASGPVCRAPLGALIERARDARSFGSGPVASLTGRRWAMSPAARGPGCRRSGRPSRPAAAASGSDHWA
ncbi:hypothetical protein ACFORG_04980 [Lutimaribacter marinistellae]|uniref:Hemolysin-type calcium-binding repeat-containing protein n=1 Tax=Lutimaribacter marinistellae TaxID=1820329 RepID=A0ABV7TC15_9RHOB